VTVGGLILAAGEGRRFGGAKQLADVGGRPLLAHAVGAMLAVAAIDPVVVVLGARAEEVRAGVDMGRASVVVAEDWASGQSASLRAGLRALGDVGAAVVTLGDMPFVTPAVIAGVLQYDPGRFDAVRATYHGHPGHPVLLGRPLLERAGELEGDVGFRDLLAGARVREFECGDLCDPVDIDTREELASIRPRSR
jgi:molybdenum cofactor cytidylyltransferase